MDLVQAIRERRSIRRYLDTEVPDGVLTAALEAATLAPTAFGYEPWRFVVVRDPQLRGRFCDIANRQYQLLYGSMDPHDAQRAMARLPPAHRDPDAAHRLISGDW